MKKKISSKSAVKQKVSAGQKVLIAVGLVAGLGAIAAGAGSFDYDRYKARRLYYKQQQAMKTMQKTSQNKASQTVQTAQKKMAYKRVYPGMVVRPQGMSSLYYIGADFKRYQIPNAVTYKSWYPTNSYGNVVTIPKDQMQKIALAGNVRIRPGSRPIKITSNPKVYTISKGGVLHAVASEALMVQAYGPKWALKVADVPDVFFINYSIGAPFTSIDSDYAPKKALQSTPTIDYDLGLK